MFVKYPEQKFKWHLKKYLKIYPKIISWTKAWEKYECLMCKWATISQVAKLQSDIMGAGSFLPWAGLWRKADYSTQWWKWLCHPWYQGKRLPTQSGSFKVLLFQSSSFHVSVLNTKCRKKTAARESPGIAWVSSNEQAFCWTYWFSL